MWLRYLSTWRRRPPREVAEAPEVPPRAEAVGAQCMCWTSLHLPFSFWCTHHPQDGDEGRLDLRGGRAQAWCAGRPSQQNLTSRMNRYILELLHERMRAAAPRPDQKHCLANFFRTPDNTQSRLPDDLTRD